MKPDWDKLMKNWNKGDRAKTSLIADVDCTSDGGKALCEQVGVRGYPSIKWGDAANLEDYQGGRTYDDLKKFAKENLKPRCSPANMDLCDEDKKKDIADIQALPADELSAKIDAKKKEIKDAEELFEKSVKELQAKYEKLQKDKESAISAVKDSGLGLMQAMQSHAKKAKQEL
jgi:hypothetical protein